tara:strand:- start:101 stop:226 length:126 start_codon:yes stop_codon:yes gene_type:complete
MIGETRFYAEGAFSICHRKELKSIKLILGTFKVEPYGLKNE